MRNDSAPTPGAAPAQARPRFATKAEWAEDKAKTLRETAARLERTPSRDHRKAPGKFSRVDDLNAEAAKFERIARREREKSARDSASAGDTVDETPPF